MMRRSVRGVGLAGLLLVLAGLTAVIWFAMEQWQARVLSDLAQNQVEMSAAFPELIELPDDLGSAAPPNHSELTERPLFMPTRRLPAVVEETASPAPEPAPEAPLPDLADLRLISVIITPSGRYAWFQEKGSEQPLRVAAGETLREWTLDDVERSHVVFRARSSEHRVDLRPVPAVDEGGAAEERVEPRKREW
jgi:hypothetical protein